jgi:hypothetical protein
VPPSDSKGVKAWDRAVKDEFVRGPLAVSWWGRACRLSGKAQATALAIWFLAGLRGRPDGLKLTTATLARFGVEDRSSKSRVLAALEQAGLTRVASRQGKNPLVTILGVDLDDGAGAAA